MAFDIAFLYCSKIPSNILTYVVIRQGYFVLNESSKTVEMHSNFTHANTAYVKFTFAIISTAINIFIHQ